MAYEGELVKLGNGRWARFQRCPIQNPGHLEFEQTSILVAVELDDEQQTLLRAAEDSLESYWRMGGRTDAEAPSITSGEEHPRPTWPGDIGALH